MFEEIDPYEDAPLTPAEAAEFAAEIQASTEAVEAMEHLDPAGLRIDDDDDLGLDPDLDLGFGLDLDLDFDDHADADARVTLRRLSAQQRALNVVGWQQLVSAAHWADLHGTVPCSGAAEEPRAASRQRGGEVLGMRGGDGTPLVAEFAPAELAAALGISTMSAGMLIADALDLRHRLPLLWECLQTGEVKVFVARRVAARTRRLSVAAAAVVDATITPRVASVPYGRLEKILDAAILSADPALAAADAKAAADRRGVWRGRDLDAGTASMFGYADAPDIAAFDTTLDTVANALALLGDDATLDVRRAKALGVLANPQATIQLVDTAEAGRRARCAAAQADADSDVDADAQAGADAVRGAEVQPRDRRRCSLGPATLHVHFSQETWAAGDGIARAEGVGPVLLEQVRDWLADRTVRLQPVIDLNDIPLADRYEVPDRIAEAVRLRTPADCFPFGVSLSRSTDLDHTDPYRPSDDGGPPGQTRIDNLGPLTRHHHRIKTHGHWKVTQPRSGVWLWRSPHNDGYLVDHAGTTSLGNLT